MTQKFLGILLCIAILLSLAGCAPENPPTSAESPNPTAESGVTITDALGNTALLTGQSRVACGYASFAECWLLAGGSLVGVTQDAIDERGLDVGDAASIGTVKSIDPEKLVAQQPDYVILSADLTAHLELQESLDQMEIAYGYFRVDTFADYKALMEQFCAVTERDDLFRENVLAVEERIDAIMEKIPASDDRTVLLLRAFSTGMKAKRDDNLAGQILKQFGTTNLADLTPSLLEELSVEEIVAQDPDYIFITTMGSESDALEYLKNNVENDPAWSELSAVKNDRYILLPQDLFHYKPNNRWDESYEYLAKILYPESFS